MIIFWSANGGFLRFRFSNMSLYSCDTVLEAHHFRHKILQLMTRPRSPEIINLPFIREIFESGASEFENRNAKHSLALRAYRKRKNHAADGPKIKEEMVMLIFPDSLVHKNFLDSSTEFVVKLVLRIKKTISRKTLIPRRNNNDPL